MSIESGPGAGGLHNSKRGPRIDTGHRDTQSELLTGVHALTDNSGCAAVIVNPLWALGILRRGSSAPYTIKDVLFRRSKDTDQREPKALDITELERKNEIYTPSQRLLEASLLVEPTFLYPAIISGQRTGLEYAFGKKQWANYLKARLLTKSYDGPLTVDFILDVYSRLLGQPRDDIIYDTRFEKGELGVGSNAGEPAPMICTEAEIAIINANPYLRWLPVTRPGSDIDASKLAEIDPIGPYLWAKHGWAVTDVPSNRGFINYICKTREEKLRGLAVIVDQYNRAEGEPHGPDKLATSLQKGIVSLHSVFDGNGTASNLLKNWSLERNGAGPSLPYPDDLIVTEEELVGHVRSGRASYKRSRLAIEAGETDPVIICGLQDERARFQRRSITPPPKLEPGKFHERSVYESFLKAVSP